MRVTPAEPEPEPESEPDPDRSASGPTAPVTAEETELGGWVPAVGRAPADDLLSEWAPRADRGGHRTVELDRTDEHVRTQPSGARWGRSRDGAADSDGSATLLDPPDDDEATSRAGHRQAIERQRLTDADADADADPDADPDADLDPETEPVRVRAHRINRGWGRFAELWVPESMRAARVDPGRRGMIVLVVVAAVAAVVAAVGVWRDRPEPRPIETAVVAAVSGDASDASTAPAAAAPDVSAGAPTAPTTPASPPQSAEILVSVTGLVASPGVVRLPPQARVADAIAAAGGTQPGANLTGMNLAAKLADGDSVVVTDTPVAASGLGSAGAGGSSAGGSSAGGSSGGASEGPASQAGALVNLNTADEAALDTLPGVGPVMAQNILSWREANGRFAGVEQLQEISGIGPSRYAQLAPLVTVG